MYTIHGTKKFLQRVGGPVMTSPEAPTTSLGNWYATVLSWRPQVALFVNEWTLVPVLMPLAPAADVLARFPAALATVLSGDGVNESFVDREITAMVEHGLSKTANRSVIGSMTEFAFLADAFRSDPAADLLALSLRLAKTPCSPLYGRHVSPDRELRALVAAATR